MTVQDVENRLRKMAGVDPRLATIASARGFRKASAFDKMAMQVDVLPDAEETNEAREISPQLQARIKAIAPVLHIGERLDEVGQAITLITQLDPSNAEWRRLAMSRIAQTLREVADEAERAATAKT